jgi:hypothetical protein
VPSCRAIEHASDRRDLYAAIRQEQEWHGGAERRFRRLNGTWLTAPRGEVDELHGHRRHVSDVEALWLSGGKDSALGNVLVPIGHHGLSTFLDAAWHELVPCAQATAIAARS